ncbi:hypothetical protein [Puia dinghuensis]|uniref:hypothetical protein n=1 Tax=Puia dinghuensis TaxID=1792502 RepID=UPI00166BF9F8|nr:hypothetical protein [Puia dinghuensis]
MPKQKGHDQCPQPDCYLNCPLCFVMVLPASDVDQPIASVFNRVYPVYIDSYAYSYHASAWKPPNEA